MTNERWADEPIRAPRTTDLGHSVETSHDTIGTSAFNPAHVVIGDYCVDDVDTCYRTESDAILPVAP